ncbi:MAG: hypothetical protein FWC40_04890 [Proteobacteria bacterium]|nr:hypothetical protein [Pseudomonadota bacterium]
MYTHLLLAHPYSEPDFGLILIGFFILLLVMTIRFIMTFVPGTKLNLSTGRKVFVRIITVILWILVFVPVINNERRKPPKLENIVAALNAESSIQFPNVGDYSISFRGFSAEDDPRTVVANFLVKDDDIDVNQFIFSVQRALESELNEDKALTREISQLEAFKVGHLDFRYYDVNGVLLANLSAFLYIDTIEILNYGDKRDGKNERLQAYIDQWHLANKESLPRTVVILDYGDKRDGKNERLQAYIDQWHLANKESLPRTVSEGIILLGASGHSCIHDRRFVYEYEVISDNVNFAYVLYVLNKKLDEDEKSDTPTYYMRVREFDVMHRFHLCSGTYDKRNDQSSGFDGEVKVSEPEVGCVRTGEEFAFLLRPNSIAFYESPSCLDD